MKITGKNSLLYWLRIPFLIYSFGFILINLWILILMGIYSVTNKTNQFISKSTWKPASIASEEKTEQVQFHYPLSKMILTTEDSFEGIGIAFLGLLSICFILYMAVKIVNQLSKDNFFTGDAVKFLNLLGYGMLSFGIIQLMFDIIVTPQSFDFTPPFFTALIGIVLLMIKEIFIKGKSIQEENELTI
ncbi:hypothetical protein BAX97_13120 [Elizabethkingia meningoseptica]|uniref:DUF2975 domain-containing protein n=1 Tax=Elizabethkingia meningoseptica TaxID=238 RepID=UPI000332D6F0|nr:DUF2975 domain-containing protein [Elizabethkingia meningoseptica]AQX04059.1 hypothetical protein BBD33_01795 [Elizabethkingia meningoseptica]AQX46100.1 hypothetical protein B5G46_01790 [Elizabethkingia meningoseptica]EOR30473.1 hypothetical protein L100_05985 [Elizabethkingia meningoseptica ATCC 13253 = NBRC 12535]KUY15392.1 hypothetical protein ATB99_12985 [Elizabethkingia meningoseptica]MCL1675306.1 DUF2975 domain-containing protein [Elizabethkingia meningoseptica]